MKVRVGYRETFGEKAHGMMFSGRKKLSTRIIFATSCTLPILFGLGAVLATTDATTGTNLSPVEPNYLAVSTLAVLATFGYFNSTSLAKTWYIDETGMLKKKKSKKEVV
jgi:hypothetical protein